MIKRLFPSWMLPNHPMLRYLRTSSVNNRSGRWGRLIFVAMVLWLFIVGGYIVASDVFVRNPFEQPFSQMLTEFLFWPTFILQSILQIAVFLIAVSTIGDAMRRQTWDSLRATYSGAALAVRTRWSAIVFYRMRGIMIVLVLVRLVLIAGMLYDLTAFRGEYLHNLTGSIEPQIPVVAAVVLLALTMTASLLLPFTSVGQATALGLLVSTFVRQRVYITLVQAAFIALRMVIIGGFLFGALQFRFDVLEANYFVVWLVLLGFAVTSDWGMSFLYLGYFGQQVWGDVPYGIFLGVGMIVMVFVQAIVTDLLLTLACRRAELSE